MGLETEHSDLRIVPGDVNGQPAEINLESKNPLDHWDLRLLPADVYEARQQQASSSEEPAEEQAAKPKPQSADHLLQDFDLMQKK